VEDNDLIALLDRKFTEADQRINAHFEQRDARFDRMDARFDRVDARFEAMDARFDRVDARFAGMDGRFEGMDGRFEGMEVRFDDLRIEVGARLDDMHTDIKKIAEGVSNVDEKLERFRAETAHNFKDVRSDIRMSFTVLGKRITKLEDNHS